jgi:LAO/AO transport system kinase
MASRGHLGGLALAAPEAIRLLDAVGRELVIVETVGVGQVEVEIAGKADTTVVVVTPGWGDAVQANKAGLMEVADVFAINKADRPGVEQTRRDLELMLDLSDLGDWRPPIVPTVGSTGAGVEAFWQAVADHRSYAEKSGLLEERRQRRLREELRNIVLSRLDARARQLCGGERYDRVEADVLERRLDPWSASDELLRGVGA